MLFLMSFALRIKHSKQRVECVLNGEIQYQELCELFDKLREDFKSNEWDLLIDAIKASFKVSADKVRVLADLPTIFRRISIVAPGAVEYGLSRMYEQLSLGRRRVLVVHTMEEALQWLDREPEVELARSTQWP